MIYNEITQEQVIRRFCAEYEDILHLEHKGIA